MSTLASKCRCTYLYTNDTNVHEPKIGWLDFFVCFKLFEKGETLMVCTWPVLKMVGDRCHTDRYKKLHIFFLLLCNTWKYIREVVEGLWREQKTEDH